MDEELADWFAREILPHEAALTRYVASARARGVDPEDARQDIYIKVWQAAGRTRPPQPRFFLFAVARNHLTDIARQRRVVPIDLLQDSAAFSVLVDEVSPERQAGSFQELERLIDAFEHLPDRCREVVWMKRVEGASQREIAQRLSIAEATVEAHLVRGMRMLTQFFHSGDGPRESRPARWTIPRPWIGSRMKPPRGS